MRARVAAFVALATLLAGCTLVKEPEMRELSGPTDGYTPTATYLKVHVKREDGTLALLNFDRRDWYTAEIARQMDIKQVPFVSAQAMPRDILNEYVAQTVGAPGELQKLRYDEMEATPEARQEMDGEYEALVREWLARAPVSSPPLPTVELPLG